jgi:hypothetical protein
VLTPRDLSPLEYDENKIETIEPLSAVNLYAQSPKPDRLLKSGRLQFAPPGG